MFDISPGDDTTYRVIFGRLPPTNGLFNGYILFGLAEGTDALITVAFTSDCISRATFSQQWRTATHVHAAHDPAHLVYLEDTAYTVFAALTGLPDTEPPARWAADWWAQLPLGGLS